jgi:hypothetical protein
VVVKKEMFEGSYPGVFMPRASLKEEDSSGAYDAIMI